MEVHFHTCYSLDTNFCWVSIWRLVLIHDINLKFARVNNMCLDLGDRINLLIIRKTLFGCDAIEIKRPWVKKSINFCFSVEEKKQSIHLRCASQVMFLNCYDSVKVLKVFITTVFEILMNNFITMQTRSVLDLIRSLSATYHPFCNKKQYD